MDIPKGMIHSWIKEEEILHSFMNYIENEAGLRRKETGLSEKRDADVYLYKWFLQEHGEEMP